MKTITSKLILALLCALAIISVVSGNSSSIKGNLRGNKGVEDEIVLDVDINEQRALKGGKGKGKKGEKSSKSPGKKCKKKNSVKSSKSPKSKGGKGKGKKGEKSSKSPKSSKGPKSGKGKGGKGKNKSSKSPKSKGKGGKGGKGYDCEEPDTPAPVRVPGSGVPSPTVFPSPTISVSPTKFISPPPSASPTNSCGLTDLDRIEGIREILSTISDLNDVDTFGTPQNLAFTWLISENPNDLFVCPQTRRVVKQRYILGVVYFSTDGDNWIRCSRGSTNCSNSNNLPFDPFLSNSNVCGWFGISCLDGAITEVILGGRNFVGANGDIPPEMFFLPQVREINFDGSRNQGETRRLGGKIPPEIGNAALLEELDLDRNELTGEIPDEIFDNIALRVLDLDNNMLTGIIPDRFDELDGLVFLTIGNNMYDSQPMPESIAQLQRLRSLGLQDSSLVGEIPASYSNLINLDALDLGNNELEGSIDVIDNYPGLISLSVNDNSFDGDVPQSLWNNKNMQVIDLENNAFTGAISINVGQMVGLATLRLAGNDFTGAIPAQLGNLDNLRLVTLEGNNFDAGSFVPEEVCIRNPFIVVTIDTSISCPGKCCTVVAV